MAMQVSKNYVNFLSTNQVAKENSASNKHGGGAQFLEAARQMLNLQGIKISSNEKIGALKPTFLRLSRTISGTIPRMASLKTDLVYPLRINSRDGMHKLNSNSALSRNGDLFSMEKYMALRSSSCRITGTDSKKSSLSMRLRRTVVLNLFSTNDSFHESVK